MTAQSLRRKTLRSRLTGRRAAHSSFMSGLARAGLTARGILYILIGIIAVEIATGSSHQQADNTGAVRLAASTPFGAIVIWLMVAGFAGMTLWRLSEAAFGAAEEGGRKPAKRMTNLARGVLYGVVTFGLLKFALGVGAPSSSDKDSVDLTAKALHYPGGQVLVTVAGIVMVGAGLYMAYRALTSKFLKVVDMSGTSRRTRTVVQRIAQIGGTARGLVFGTVGVFLIVAAIDENPDQAKGLDSALRALARTPLGPWLLIVVALGLIVFGVYSFCEARWRRV